MRRKRSGKAMSAESTADSAPMHGGSTSRPRKRRNYARWRAVSLSLVYVVFAVHIIHWKITGKTLAPLELNEVMYTLELGIVTAGFIFMCLLVVGTLIFGRFFCSWACHIMVLQDLCAWLLGRVGIRAKPIRSRLLLLVPPLTAFYMFVWPQLVRAWESRALPTFHLATDAQGWASFATTNFWRNLPGPWMIGLTFLVCGFAIVHVLGSRTFCTYVCPYGAVFALADRFSPGRIKVDDSCRQCGRCTATCTSGVRVHDEVRIHGMIVNPACLKDLDCVAVCPQGALHYGFSRPALFKSFKSGGRFGIPYQFSMGEELLMSGVFLFVLLSMRGLYARIPFLLSLAMGVVVGYLTVLAVRLLCQNEVSFAHWKLKTLGRWTAKGGVFAIAIMIMHAFIGHSAVVRYHEYSGMRAAFALDRTEDPVQRKDLAAAAFGQFSFVERWGLFSNPLIEREMLDAAAVLDQGDTLDQLIVRYLDAHPYDASVNLLKARRLAEQGMFEEAARQYEWITAHDPEDETGRRAIASAYAALGMMHAKRGAFAESVTALEQSLRFNDQNAEVRGDLGGALAEVGRIDEAITVLQEAVRLAPTLGKAQYNLATLLGQTRRHVEAVEHYRLAVEQLGDDADVLNNFGAALLRLRRIDEARNCLERAIALNPDHADAQFNMGAVCAAAGDAVSADAHFRRAVSLDPRYAAYLETPER